MVPGVRAIRRIRLIRGYHLGRTLMIIIMGMETTIIVQAGGESKRMGQDKALLPFLGKPLIERVISRIAPLAGELIIISNSPEKFAFLNLPVLSDLVPGRGALGGLLTALSAANKPFMILVACDMPFANPGLLAYGRDLLVKEDVDVVVPRTAHGTEPFHAVYRRDTCLPLVEKAVQAGFWRVDSWFGEARMRYLTAEEIALYDPAGLAFRNVNTPEELAEAEEAAVNGVGDKG